MQLKFALMAAAMVGLASAECPNACSGAGKCGNYSPEFSPSPLYKYTLPEAFDAPSDTGVPDCGTIGANENSEKKDTCVCFTSTERGRPTYAFSGPDCSQRVCPSGTAFAATPYKQVIGTDATIVHNEYLACSGKGTCDKETGTCQCLPGFTGAACERTTCPNDCSGRGVCSSIKQIAKSVAENSASYIDSTTFAAVRYSQAWDAEKIRGCVCDTGSYGPDCSLSECPSTADPLGGRGAAQGKHCSGRGTCDTSTGTCVCLPGFKGNMCQTQSAYVM